MKDQTFTEIMRLINKGSPLTKDQRKALDKVIASDEAEDDGMRYCGIDGKW